MSPEVVGVTAILLSIPYASNLVISRLQTITNLEYASNKTRILRWGFALVMFLRHPIIGNGYNSFKFTYVNRPELIGTYLSQFRMGAHNEYLQVLAEQGVIGLSIVIGFIASLFIKFRKHITPVTVVAVFGILAGLLNSGVNFLMHTTAGVLFLAYALVLEKGVSYE